MELLVLERLQHLERKYEILNLRQQISQLDLVLFSNPDLTEAEYVEYSKEIKRLDKAASRLEKVLLNSYKQS